MDEQRWAEERLRRLAVVMRWIHVGEMARRHCEEHSIPQGTAPWSGLIGEVIDVDIDHANGGEVVA